MAEETQPKPTEPETSKPEASVLEPTKPEASVEPKPAEESKPKEEAKPAEEPKPAEESKPAEEATPATETAAEEADAAAEAVAEESGVAQSESFKEESNKVADLEDPEKKALDELKQLIQSALTNKEFTPPPPPPLAKSEEAKVVEKEVKAEEEVKAEKEVKAEEVQTKVEEVKEEKVEEVKAEDSVKTEEEVKAEKEVKAEEEVKAEKEVKAEEEQAKVEEVKEEKVEEVKAEEVKKEETIEEAKTEEVGVKIDEQKAEEEVKIEVEKIPTEEKEVALEEGSGETVEETPAAAEEPEPETEEEVFIWGVPLLGDVKSDTVLLKFLRARDFKVKDAMAMIKNAVIWRKQFGIEKLVEEDLEISELEKAVFYHGIDKEGHPVCYNVYGEFQDKEFYGKVFGDDEKREKFLRWRIQYLEKGIREKLDFSPEGVCSMVQVTDLKNTPGPGKKELRVATNKALTLLQDNYPEFVAKQIFINVPWWYLAYNRVISPFFTQRTQSKFVFAGPSKSTETLFKYIAPEQVPVQYGGLNKENDHDFTIADSVTEVTIKPTSKHTVEIPTKEGSVLVWELRVLGWEVSYGAEFSPDAENGYTVIIQKARKFTATDEPYVKNSFKIGEPGKVVLTIDNTSSKKKKLLYRYKEKTATEST